MSMSLSSLSTILLSFSLVFPSVTCFDITKLLSQYPAYSTFSNYLTQTQLAGDINSRNSITVLAVDNAGMAPISGKSMHVIKKVLSIHVILDYFDVQRLQHLQNQSVTVRTLLDSSGQVQGLQGFIKITDLSTGAVSFISASDTDDAIGANLIKALVSQPYNISVVQVSTVIMPPFLLANSNAPSPAPVTTPVPMPVPSPTPVISVTPVPVPVVTPVPVPVASPVPVTTPVPVSPVPVPVQTPIPVVSPVAVPVYTPVPVPAVMTPPGASDAAGAGDTPPNKSQSGAGIPKGTGVMTNRALPFVLTLFSTYVLSTSHTVHVS